MIRNQKTSARWSGFLYQIARKQTVQRCTIYRYQSPMSWPIWFILIELGVDSRWRSFKLLRPHSNKDVWDMFKACISPRVMPYTSSNGCHYGPIFFKPEKNLEFFRLKNWPIDGYPGKLEWLTVNNLVYFWDYSGWAYNCDSFLGYWE